MIMRGPTPEAVKKVAMVGMRAKKLGWSEERLWELACSLDDDETCGEVTESYIEILGGPCRQFFTNCDKPKREAHASFEYFASWN